MRYGIDARKGFIVVTGEAGTGKTTVLKRLINSLETHVHSACVFDPHLSFLELLRGVLCDLGMTPVADSDRLSMMMQLYDFLIEQLEKGHIVTLMVDEAQSMSITMLEELRLLSNLETDTEKLIQIILVGQPGLVEKLDRPELVQLKQRVALRCRIRPLEESDVGLYIASRVKTVKYTRRDLFDSECVKRVARYSKGIPRLVNVICDNALLIACAAGRRWVSVDDIVEAAQELQLVDISEVPVAAEVGSATQGAGAERFRPLWERPPSAIDTAPQFEPSVMDKGYRSGHSRARRAAHTRNYAGIFVLSLLVGTLLFFAVQQKLLPLPAFVCLNIGRASAVPMEARHTGATRVNDICPSQRRFRKRKTMRLRRCLGHDGATTPGAIESRDGKSSSQVAQQTRNHKITDGVRSSGDATVSRQRLNLKFTRQFTIAPFSVCKCPGSTTVWYILKAG